MKYIYENSGGKFEIVRDGEKLLVSFLKNDIALKFEGVIVSVQNVCSLIDNQCIVRCESRFSIGAEQLIQMTLVETMQDSSIVFKSNRKTYVWSLTKADKREIVRYILKLYDVATAGEAEKCIDFQEELLIEAMGHKYLNRARAYHGENTKEIKELENAIRALKMMGEEGHKSYVE